MKWFAIMFVWFVGLFAIADDEPIIKIAKSKLKDTNKPFTLIVTANIKDGAMSKLTAAFAPCAAATRKEPGCVCYELHTDPDKAGTIVLLERWKSLAALEAHLKQAHTQTFLKTMPEWSAAAPDLKFLVPVE